jgi:predicted DNA binding CopG/RHH family protein
LLDIVEHPNVTKYPNQRVLVVSFDGYVYLATFVEKVDTYEQEVFIAFEKGRLTSVATKGELEKFEVIARATAEKDRGVNIRMPLIDLNDIQIKALQEGMPYQTLIASVLQKYVSGHLVEKAAFIAGRSTQTNRNRVAGKFRSSENRTLQ